MYTVSLQDFIGKMDVENLTPQVDVENIEISQSDVNRPALQLAGFFDYFDHHRIQIIGQVEHTYMEKQGVEKSTEMVGRIMSYKVIGSPSASTVTEQQIIMANTMTRKQ